MNDKFRHIEPRRWAILVLLLVSASMSFGQDVSTNQVLTLQVFETNKIDINQRALSLVINQASLETGAPVEAVNEDGVLVWLTNGENKKISVATNNASPRFLVKIHALDITGSSAVAAPEVILNDNLTKDLVMGVSKSWGKCKIHLSASAKVADGTGTDTHIITYTITGG